MNIWWPVVLVGSAALVLVLVQGLMSWRIQHFPHATATITEVWQEQVQIQHGGNGGLIVDLISEPQYRAITMGTIQFRREHRGKTYDCTWSLELGVPADAYHVGERLEVVPATGTCHRVDIIRRMPPL